MMSRRDKELLMDIKLLIEHLNEFDLRRHAELKNILMVAMYEIAVELDSHD